MKTRLQLVVALLGIAALAAVFAQGPLTPPSGAPSPTMKTLAQVEPRIPLNDTTARGDANYQHIIIAPGSYYLTANLDVSKPNGIDIRAEGVTLDLDGFEIRRTAGSGGNGIEIDAGADRCTVRDGSLNGFAFGMRCATPDIARGGHCLRFSVSGCTSDGIHTGEGWQLEGCTAHDNAGAGIRADDGSTLTNCAAIANSTGIIASLNCSLINCTAAKNTAGGAISAANGSTLTNCSVTGNTGPAGISAGTGCALMNCSVQGNTVAFGIDADSGCTLTNCVTFNNAGAGASTSGGINAAVNCTLIGCAAVSNQSSIATLSASTGFGIRVSTGSTVRDCTANSNVGDGIQVNGDRCTVASNSCATNSIGGQGAGIHITAGTNACRIEGNHCTGGIRSFLIEGTDNLIVRNSAQGAIVANYDIGAGNHDAVRVISPGAAFASTSPWVNFSF